MAWSTPPSWPASCIAWMPAPARSYWEFDLKASTWSSPFYVDGKVYMGTDDGTLFVFAHGKELQEAGEDRHGAKRC